MTLTLHLDPKLEAQLRTEAARLGLDADALAIKAISEQLNHAGDTTPDSHLSESQLLQQINRGMSEQRWERYDQLAAKRDDETLTEAEHHELIQLSDEIERANVERLYRVAELARLRNVSLTALMQQLGIGPRTTGGEDA